MECWTCGEKGHIARFCKQITCYKCGKRGHVASQCGGLRQNRQIRCLENVEEDWESDDFTDFENESIIQGDIDHTEETEVQIHVMHVEDELEKEILALTIHQDSVKKTRGKTAYKNECANLRTKKTYPREIIELAEFIEGKAKKPNKSTPTLISSTHSERAQNKPVVKGLCETTKTKLFCDSGAEVNVMDNSLFEKLRRNEKRIKVHSARKIIRCANNSKISVLGWARLSITVGGFRKTCKFWVVPKIFPRIILGIRAMKDMEMSIDPAKDCVWVKGVREPFLSKVNSQSLVSKGSGKGQLPGLRVEGRQM